MSMSPRELVQELIPFRDGLFPRATLREIVARREETVGPLLEALRELVAESDADRRNDSFLPNHLAYLLAQFRETRAYRPLVDLLALPGRRASDLFGDLITESMGRVLASVYDGDEAPLRRLLEDRRVSEYVRGAAVADTYAVLIANGLIDPSQVEDYWVELLESKLEREGGFAWDALCLKAAELGFARALPAIRRAFDEGLCSPGFCSLAELEDVLEDPSPSRDLDDLELIEDAIGEIEGWACFRHHSPRQTRRSRHAAPERVSTPPPPKPAVGRNDPCPCGSGRKFKKCCGNEVTAFNARQEARKQAMAMPLRVRIELAGSDPPVWRELLVPGTFTLAELHMAIQAVMPWDHDHLHVFSQQDATVRFPAPKSPIDSLDEEAAIFMHELLGHPHPLVYTYDMGDDWEHWITVELWKDDAGTVDLPACIAGAGAAPPDSFGGIHRYNEVVAALAAGGKDALDEETRDHLGEDFSPGDFSVTAADGALASLKGR